MRRIQTLLSLMALLALAAWAQANRGTITGTVTDPSGAVVAGAQVTATQVETGVNYSTVSTEAGAYSIVNLPTGTYDVRIMFQGFKTFEQKQIRLEVGQTGRVDAALQMGSAAESVTVQEQATMLATDNATVGTNINSRALTDLPLQISGGRNAETFAFKTIPGVEGSNYETHIQGSPGMSKLVLIDGADATAGLQGFVNAPGVEALQAVEVRTNSLSAEAGATAGGAILYEMKSGTNQLHGSAYYFLRNEWLNANTWSNNWWEAYTPQNAARYKRPRDRFKDYGLSGGGPIWKNHTFLFASYEMYDLKNYGMTEAARTVPTADFLKGDFSALLDTRTSYGADKAGNPIYKGAIFDPSAPGTVFPGNIIPTSRLSKQALKMVDLYKQYSPTVPGALINNYPGPNTGTPSHEVKRWDGKFDHNFSDRNHAFASVNWWDQPRINSDRLWQVGTTDGGPLNNGQGQDFTTYGVRISDSHTISPTLVNTFIWAYNSYSVVDFADRAVDPKGLGFTGFDGVLSDSLAQNLPIINFGSGVNGFSEMQIGSRFADFYWFKGQNFKDTMSWVHGKHTVKFGGDYKRLKAASDFTGGVQTYNFSNLTGAPTDPKISPFVGFGFANFMLGAVQSASMTVGGPIASHRQMFNTFIQDDFKVSRRLTLNLGMRWDVNFPLYEDQGRWTQFDINAQNPNWAPYKGAWAFAENGGNSFYVNNNYHQFGPSIGAAYQLTKRAVLRGGFGLYYVPMGQNYWKATPAGQNYGFTGDSSVINNIQDATAFNWDNGYPGKVVMPVRSASLSTFPAGLPAAYIDPDILTMGHTRNWNIGVQYEVAKDLVVDLNYVGNQGRGLNDGSLVPYNFPTQAKYLSLLSTGHANDRVTSPADAAAAGVSYPYAGFNGYAWQTILPYPQTRSNGKMINWVGSPIGVSGYNAMSFEVRNRGAHGVNMDMSYGLSKATTNVEAMGLLEGSASRDFQDPYAYASEGNVLASYDQRHIVKGYITYDLPFGRNRKWLSSNRMLDYVIGGWTIGAQLRYNSGAPMGKINSSNSYPGWSAVYANLVDANGLANPFKDVNLAWNPANGPNTANLFFDPKAFANPAYGSFGNQPRFFNNWRGWSGRNEDISIVKRFAFGPDGRVKATLRAEFFNAFNRHTPGGPNGDITSPYFGHITGVGGNRTGQAGARVEW